MPTTEKLRVSGTQGVNISLSMYVSDCPSCGVIFGITSDLEKNRRRDGSSFYCPNGHSLSFGESEAERARKRTRELERQLAQEEETRQRFQESLRREREQHKATQRQASAYKGQATRARKRAAAAVCPCCNRSFVQLRRHLEAKHPDYTREVLAGADA